MSVAEKPTSMCISVQEAAAAAGVSESTIRDMIRAGEWPFARRVGRQIRIHRPSFEHWLAGITDAAS